MTKYYELTPEEQAQLEDIEGGAFVSVKNLAAAKKEAIAAAKRTLSKTKNINIRLSESDLLKLKARAAREGVPYQTLASSIIHQSTKS